ncbi:MAG: class I SAM-dependent methyltransferase [Patescibacteria group bacterium]
MPTKIKQIIDRHFFRPAWYSVLINPYFIARYGLLKKIKKFAAADFTSQTILDVGCGSKPYASLFPGATYIGIDIAGGGHFDQAKIVDKFYNGTTIPFPDNNFDAVICTEVLEHAGDPEKLLSEIRRVLKTNGQVFLTMPLVWSEHEIPNDFRRFTRYEHKRIFAKSGLTIEKLEETSGVFRVCGQLIAAFIFERLFLKNKPFKLLSALILCFPIQIIFIILDFIFRNSWLTLDYAITAKK